LNCSNEHATIFRLMETFLIEFDARSREWRLHAHPLLNPSDLRFGCDCRGGGHVGLFGALGMVLLKARRHGGKIVIRHFEEERAVFFPAADVPELANLERVPLAD